MNDLKFAFRQLLKQPGFTAVAVLTLALGIGANTAIFSVVNSTLLNPVPGPEPERLMQIAEQNREQQQAGFFNGVGPPVLQALRENQDFFSDLVWADIAIPFSRKTGDFTERVQGSRASSDFFGFWNARPILGRTFAPDEAVPIGKDGMPSADSVIVITYAFWKSHFGGDADVIGKSIELSGRRFAVIGVMPSHFGFPWGGDKFWLPAEEPHVRPDLVEGPNYKVFARLKPGVSEQQVQAMLDVLTQRLLREYPRIETPTKSDWSRYGYGTMFIRKEGWSIRIRPLRDIFVEGQLGMNLQRTLLGLVGALGFVLLIACANVANLILARTENRQQELTIRAALGAGRVRLMRQVLTESVLLAFLGGLAGLVITVWGMMALESFIPYWRPHLKEVRIDAYALGVTLLISLATGLAAGLAPGLRASRVALANAMKQAGTGATVGVGWRRYHGALVVIQVALALILLTGAGLMIENVVRLLHVNPGFDPENLVRVSVPLPWEKYDRKREKTSLLLADLRERFAALPGVKAVGIEKESGFPEKFNVDDGPQSVELHRVGCGVEESDLFRAMRVPLLAGRYFNRDDIGEGTGTAIINETMAQLCWPEEVAVGRKFRAPGAPGAGDQVYEVVGVVGDIRDYSYDQEVFPTFYRPYQELDLQGGPPTFLMRIQTDPRALTQVIRKELKAAEPAMGTPDIHVVKQQLYDSTLARRTYMSSLMVIAAAGLLLSALGVYGVLSYAVTRRTREIGIRTAMGAERRRVLGMVLREGARLIGVGVVAGLVAALCLTRLLGNQLFKLFEVRPNDPVVLAGVLLFLFAVALLACWLPARRAAKIDPMEALRYE
ncbi:MAG TPA: ABC transporter permease [Verrucomicrobiae bacterium]|nr:ABC transporter permease [Verrucomicrobiae bacterium]